MNIKNYKELKFAEDNGFCVSCATNSLVILNKETFDTIDILMCMNCGMTCNQYLLRYPVTKTYQIPVVEMNVEAGNMSFTPKVVYGTKREGFYYQAHQIGSNGENNN